jgi:hypothetical protein
MAVQLQQEDPLKAQRRKLVASVIFVSILVHVLAGIAATIWIVARYLTPPEATFVASKSIALPPKVFDPKMASAELEASAPKPVLDQQLASLRATDFALPDVPRMPVDQVVDIDPSVIVSDQLTGLLAGTGGAGSGGGGGGGGNLSAVNFFGIKDQARRVVIVVDTSNSMFERSRSGKMHFFDFKTIKEEAVKLINNLSINTLFNVVVYEGGSMAFSEEMMAATDANKQSSRQWIMDLEEDPGASIGGRKGRGPKLMEGGGTRLDTAMKQTFGYKPDVVFLITDGEINRGDGGKIDEKEMLSIIEEFQKLQPEPSRIHVVHYLTTVVRPEEEDTLKAIARRNKGQYIKVDAKELSK